jgi:hypothetical protein
MKLLGLAIGLAALAGCTSTVENDDPTKNATSTSSNATSVTSTTAASSGSGGAGGTGGSGGGHEGGAQSQTCLDMQDITMTNPLLDAGPDGIWSAGETATIEVTLTSPQDTFEYPGIVATHGSAILSPPTSENWLFGLLANQPTPVTVPFTADPQAPPNSSVNIVVELNALNQSCVGLASVTLSATVD